MNLTRIILALLLYHAFCVVNSKTYAQAPGFHGKLFNASVGSGINSSFLTFGPIDRINDSKSISLLPPKINLALEYAINQRVTLEIQSSFLALPNSRFYTVNSANAENVESLIVDTVKLRSNMFNLSTGFRRYSEFSYYGRYLSFGVSGNYFNTLIYPSVYRNITVNGVNQKNEIENLEPGRQWTYNFSLYFGLGWKNVNLKYITLDYGINTWLFLGADKNFNIGNDYRNELRKIVDHLVFKRAQEAHLIEIYLKIGILK